jgi:hypothetical protein
LAIDQGTEVVPATTVFKSRRSWRTNIESRYGSNFVVTSYRQSCKKDAAGNLTEPLIDDTTDPVVFSFNDVARRTFTRPDGSVFPGAQIAADISTVIDTIDKENIDALKAAQAEVQST